MTSSRFIEERRPLAAQRKHYGIRPDDKVRIDGALRSLRDMPREVIINRDEIIHFVQRQAGLIQAVVADLEVLQPVPARPPRVPIDTKRTAEAVFAKPARKHEHRREIVSAKGRRVRVVEAGVKRQLELSL